MLHLSNKSSPSCRKMVTIFNDFYKLKNKTEDDHDNFLIKIYSYMFIDPSSVCNILGYYYQKIKKQNFMAKKCYEIAISDKNSDAMINLALFYENKDNKKTIKYYKMAIENKNAKAMNHMGAYYYETEKNYKEAIKYYKMAIEYGYLEAMINLGTYYYKIEKNYSKAIKYYQTAIDHGYDDKYGHVDIINKEIDKLWDEIDSNDFELDTWRDWECKYRPLKIIQYYITRLQILNKYDNKLDRYMNIGINKLFDVKIYIPKELNIEIWKYY